MFRRIGWGGMITMLILSACTNVDSRKQTQEDYYFDYKISGDEERGEVALLLNYRLGRNGQSVLLPSPAGVQVDGEIVKGDSAGLSGPYYELRYRLEDFTGEHHIIYTDQSGKEYKEAFNFLPFKLAEEMPIELASADQTIRLEGLGEKETVLVVLTDTAFATEDINQVDTVLNGELLLKKTDLDRLKAGPVTMELYKIERRPLQQTTSKGGRLLIEYGLKREVTLKER